MSVPFRTYLNIICIAAITSTALSQTAQVLQDTVGGRPFNIYLPPEYASSTDRYPSMYMLRGMEDEWLDVNEDASRRGNIVTVIDSLMANGSIGKMIYVFPRMPGPGFYDSDLDYWQNELVPYVDSVYRTLPSRYYRGIDGFSNGGGSAVMLTSLPHMMISVGAYDSNIRGIDFGWWDSMLVSNAEFRSHWDELHYHFSAGEGLTGTNRAITQVMIDSTRIKWGKTNSFDPIVLAPGAIHNWYFADLHASLTLPRHWDIFRRSLHRFSVSFTGPAADSRISGTVPVSWTIADPEPRVFVRLYVSNDEGSSWTSIGESTSPDTTIQWNTSLLPDGSLYRMRLVATGDTSFAEMNTSGRFSIDNPGNVAPDAVVIAPLTSQRISGDVMLEWIAGDAEGDPVSLSLDLSDNGGETWTSFGDQIALHDSLTWNSRENRNTERAYLRLTAISGTDTTRTLAGPYVVSNERQQLPTSYVRRAWAVGDPTFILNVIDAAKLTGNTYRISFHESIPGSLLYDVQDLSTMMNVLNSVPLGKSGEESPLFDGLRMAISFPDKATFDADASRWMVGTSTLEVTAMIPEIYLGADTVRGQPYPADYLVVMTDTVTMTTMSELGVPATDVRWFVWNMTEDVRSPVVYVDSDLNGGLSHSDEILIYDTTGGSRSLTWDLVLSTPSGYTPPVAGDWFLVKITKPIQDGDIFDLSTAVVGIAYHAAIPVSPVVHEVYPNPFNPSTTISFVLSERSDVEISVHTLLGQRIMTISERALSPGEYQRIWRPLNLPSGIYFIRTKITSDTEGNTVQYFTRKAMLLK